MGEELSFGKTNGAVRNFMYFFSFLIFHCFFERGLGGGPLDAIKW